MFPASSVFALKVVEFGRKFRQFRKLMIKYNLMLVGNELNRRGVNLRLILEQGLDQSSEHQLALRNHRSVLKICEICEICGQIALFKLRDVVTEQ